MVDPRDPSDREPSVFDKASDKAALDDAAFADLLAEEKEAAGLGRGEGTRSRSWRQLHERFPVQGASPEGAVSSSERKFWRLLFVGGMLLSTVVGGFVAWMMLPDFPRDLTVDQGVGLSVNLQPIDLQDRSEIRGDIDVGTRLGFRVGAEHRGYMALFMVHSDGPPTIVVQQQRLEEGAFIDLDENLFAYQVEASDPDVLHFCAVAADSPSRLNTFVSSLASTRGERLSESCVRLRVNR